VDNSLTGTDINESTLLTVPSANLANAANNSDLLDGLSSEAFARVVLPADTDSGTNSYIRVPSWITGSAPPSVDCDQAQETGRITVRDDGTTNLYICTGTGGWVGK
jgi:hypothetical protein